MKSSTSNKARIKDIARLAGVSIGTVDRVIHNRGEVAEETQQKVRRILQETNYSPNLMAQVLKSKKKFSLVTLLPEPSEDNSFWKKHPEGTRKALEELGHFPLSLTEVNFDMQSEKDFQKKSEYVLSLHPDGVILAPIFKKESTAFSRKLEEENIPLVFIDGFLEKASYLAYIGENIFSSGRVAGQLLDILTPPGSDILVVTIARNISNVHHLDTRTQGCLSYFEGEAGSGKRRITLNISDPSPKSISLAMDRTLGENPAIASAFLTGSRSYLLARYLENRGENRISIVGYDLLDENIGPLKKGIIRFLINQRPDEQTYKAVKKLFEFLSMKKVPEKVEYLPVDIVTKENVDFYIQKQNKE